MKSKRVTGGEPRAGMLPVGAWPALHRLAHWVGVFLLRVAYRTRIRHRERVPADGGLVLVANHDSLADAPLLFGALKRDAVFLTKQELFRGPLGWFLRRIGQLPIRRGSADREPLMAATRVLRAGGVVAVFPEGTRHGGLDSARHGAAWLARSTDSRVLPVVCRGTARPEGSGRRFRPRVEILFGPPVRLSATKGRKGLEQATDEVRAELAGLLAELDGTATTVDDPDEDVRGNQA